MNSHAPKISAIIVAYNEELLITQITSEIRKQKYAGDIEIILADGGSTDKTIEIAKSLNIKVVMSSEKGKAYQMNAAASEATGNLLFFAHADMQFNENLFDAISKATNSTYSGGGFANEFDTNNKKIKRYGNWFNLRLFSKKEQSDKKIFYGDNGIFVLKDAFMELGGFKEIPIMEDYDFSKRLNNRYQSIKISDPKIIVSSRRHVKAGFIKTRIQWVLIRKLFKWGVSPYSLAKWYKDVR